MDSRDLKDSHGIRSLYPGEAGGDRARLKDFPILPQLETQAPVMAVNTHSSATSVIETIKQLKGTKFVMESVTRGFCRGFALKTGAVFIGVTGTGSFVNEMCCSLPDRLCCALKHSKASRDNDRIHNDLNMRKGAFLLAVHDNMRKKDVKEFFQIPISAWRMA